MKNVILVLNFLLVALIALCSAHGRMENPPARNSAWRHGFNTPPNYNDIELNCGGAGQQHLQADGKCGVCGDSFFESPRPHEVGGKYATGRIVRYYNTGDVMDVSILLTANHIGYFEFRLCPVNNPKIEATHECLERNILQIIGHGTRYRVRADDRDIKLFIKLPDGFSCSQCVLQWKYRAGNNWGTENGLSGLGYGAQEEFYNCADIAIGKLDLYTTSPPTTTTTTTLISQSTIEPTKPTRITTTTTSIPTTITATTVRPSTTTTTTTVRPTTTTPLISTTTTKRDLISSTYDYRDLRYILCEVDDNWKIFDGMYEYCIRVCSDPDRECPLKFCKCHGINTWLK